jgi:glycine oxidase
MVYQSAKRMKVVIAGGGVIGSAIAFYLTAAGADAVLVERGELAGEASGAAAGLLVPPDRAAAPGPFRDICLASLALYRPVIERVQRESGIDVQCLGAGILIVAQTESRVALLQAHARWQTEHGVPTRWLKRAELSELEPALSPQVHGAAFSEGELNVDPGQVTRAFAFAAKARGADLRTGTMLTGFLGRGSRVTGVSTNLGDIPDADCVVLAAGPWTEALARRLGAKVPTPPRRGQMIAYRADAVRHAIWGEDGYLVPKAGGLLYAGATVEDVGFRKRTTPRALAGLRRMAAVLVPGLRRVQVASEWAGLRPGSPDDLPTIGRLPEKDNVYLATGHFRNGILLAPITGKLISQLIVEGRTDLPLEPFSPARFAA